MKQNKKAVACLILVLFFIFLIGCDSSEETVILPSEIFEDILDYTAGVYDKEIALNEAPDYISEWLTSFSKLQFDEIDGKYNEADRLEGIFLINDSGAKVAFLPQNERSLYILNGGKKYSINKEIYANFYSVLETLYVQDLEKVIGLDDVVSDTATEAAKNLVERWFEIHSNTLQGGKLWDVQKVIVTEANEERQKYEQNNELFYFTAYIYWIPGEAYEKKYSGGNTREYDGSDTSLPKGTLVDYRVGTLKKIDNGWHLQGIGTGW